MKELRLQSPDHACDLLFPSVNVQTQAIAKVHITYKKRYGAVKSLLSR